MSEKTPASYQQLSGQFDSENYDPKDVKTYPTILVRRSATEENPTGRIVTARYKKIVDKDRNEKYIALFDAPEGENPEEKDVSAYRVSDEGQSELANELAVSANRPPEAFERREHLKVQAELGKEAVEQAVEEPEDKNDIHAYLRRAREKRLAAEASGEAPFTEITSETTEEEYIPGEFAGLLYKFKADYTQVAQEVSGRMGRSIVALDELNTLLDRGDHQRAFISKAQDQFAAIKSEAQSEMNDAGALRKDASNLLQKQDDGNVERGARLHALASDLSSELHENGSNIEGYASRLLDTLDGLSTDRGSVDHVQEELRSDMRQLRIALISTRDDWSILVNRLDGLTQ